MSGRWLYLVVFLLCCRGALAAAENLLTTLSGTELNQTEVLQKYGLSAGGWLGMGVTYATDNPSNHNNLPVTFNDRSGDVLLNQFDVFVERVVDKGASDWKTGGRLDVLFGSDSRYTQAAGLDDNLIGAPGIGHYDLAVPQAYLEVYAPIAQGVTAKIGHFYTIIGHEVVMAPNNFFYSHAYTMQYGEPFTHTGVLFNYDLNNNFAVNSGAVMGWDNFDQNPGNWSFLGDISWTDDAADNAVSWSVISGAAGNRSMANRTLSSLVVSRNFSDKLQYVFQHDFGFQEQAVKLSATAYWYGVNQYLFYKLTGALSAGLRAEWFRDNNGVRLNTGFPGDYYAVTAGINWKAKGWLTLRPELRYDWADSLGKPYANQSKNQQLEFAVDMILNF